MDVEHKVLLLVLDGFGVSKSTKRNAIKAAKMPFYNSLLDKYPHTTLKASGNAVGLPKGVMGNSEVGHLTLGAGRVIDSDLHRINKSIKDGTFFKNKVLLSVFKHAKKKKEKVHLMGLLSDGGVHSHINHLFALLEMAKKVGVKEVYIHAFLDGRDTPPTSAKKYVLQLQKKMKQLGVGKIATIMGRYYAMDRDNRWKREHRAYDCMVNCKGRKRKDVLSALDEFYAKGETDEFIKPTVVLDKCVVDKNDGVIFFNFRSDRARELTRAFVWGEFKGFSRRKIGGLNFVSLTQYDSLVKVPVAFPPIFVKNSVGEVIAKQGISQLRVAETEKWAHVTYFFNGLCECIFPHERRSHVQSRKVSTYDKTPAMKAEQVTSKLLNNIDGHGFFLLNFANPDMVGHTGNFKATVKALKNLDTQLKRLVESFNGTILITSDHGNCEDMYADCSTCHTTNEVPFVVVNKKWDAKKINLLKKKIKTGGLQDVAPTVLKLLGIKKPSEMTGRSLL